MAEYVVHFADSERHIGPVEVHYVRVLDNGWVEVQRRKASKSVVMYPPHAVLKIRMPKPEADVDLPEVELPEEELPEIPEPEEPDTEEPQPEVEPPEEMEFPPREGFEGESPEVVPEGGV